MILRQTFSKSIYGYFDYGPKQVFDWELDSSVFEDNKGKFIRVGSFQANKWFNVALGKTVKQTLSNAKRKLQFYVKKGPISCTFEFVKSEPNYYEKKIFQQN